MSRAVGILVGAAAVGGSIVLRPGAEPTPLPTSSAASQAPSSSAAGSGSAPASTPSPAPGVAIAIASAKASTVVGDRPKFGAAMAIDHDFRTAWQEGATDEAGQWIEVTFGPVARLDAVVINNGYQLSVAAYQGNRRLKDIKITVDGGAPITVRLKDDPKAQRVDLGGIVGATTLRIEIVTTYDPKKTSYAGSPFDDASISEIALIGVPGT